MRWGNGEFADLRAAHDTLDKRTRSEIQELDAQR